MDDETYMITMFLDPIINGWIYIVTVALVFTIAIRKRNGLWTIMQPWMDGQTPPALVASSVAKGLDLRHLNHIGRYEEVGRHLEA